MSGWLVSLDYYVNIACTYHTQSTDEFLRRINPRNDNHLDKVRCDADNDDHADGLKKAN